MCQGNPATKYVLTAQAVFLLEHGHIQILNNKEVFFLNMAINTAGFQCKSNKILHKFVRLWTTGRIALCRCKYKHELK